MTDFLLKVIYIIPFISSFALAGPIPVLPTQLAGRGPRARDFRFSEHMLGLVDHRAVDPTSADIHANISAVSRLGLFKQILNGTLPFAAEDIKRNYDEAAAPDIYNRSSVETADTHANISAVSRLGLFKQILNGTPPFAAEDIKRAYDDSAGLDIYNGSSVGTFYL
ncbi:hypothetical protein FA95DRAFT_1574794, partial [Auriscalpium vulgare]